MGGRRKARALALQALYESDATGHDAKKVIMRLVEGTELSEENRAFAVSLASGVIQNGEEIDRRMLAPGDKIKLGEFELLFERISSERKVREEIKKRCLSYDGQ